MNHNNVPMTEILPYLYLGNRSDANNVNGLTANGIGFILNLTTSATDYPQESNIITRHINILDSVYQCLKDTYQSAFDFIDEANKCNSKVLIHCEAGISRSPTITVAYLIYKKQMEALEAYNFVKKLRPIVSPNFGFMGQLMELENELLPEKVALRLEKEAKLQKEAIKQKEERLKEQQVKPAPLVEKIVVENRLQLSKPVRNPIKPSTLSLKSQAKKPTLPKPLSIDLPVLPNPANKYVLPIVTTTAQLNLVQNEVSNQNVNPNVVKLASETCDQPAVVTNQPKTSSPLPKCNQQTSSSSSSSSKLVIVNSSSSTNDCTKDNQTMPKSTSQPQLSNSINNLDKIQLIDSNNNISPSEDVKIDVKLLNGIISLSKLIEDKTVVNLNLSIVKVNDTSTDKLIDKSTDKSTDKPIEKLNDKSDDKLKEKVVEKSEVATVKVIKSANVKTNSQQATNLQQSNLPRSVPTSNACTPSNKQAICLSDLLHSNGKSVSQSSLFITTTNSSTAKPEVKPLRPSTLFLNANVPRKIKNNVITPSSLCSPLTAFAVSSTKSSPTLNFSNNLSSPFDTNEKLTKRRWLGETNCYQEFSQDFSPPDCKKKSKQKKLKNISVEVN